MTFRPQKESSSPGRISPHVYDSPPSAHRSSVIVYRKTAVQRRARNRLSRPYAYKMTQDGSVPIQQMVPMEEGVATGRISQEAFG
jgi:hypothetical protein